MTTPQLIDIEKNCGIAAQHIRDEITWKLQHEYEPSRLSFEELQADLRQLENAATQQCAAEGDKVALRLLRRLCEKWGVI